MHPFRLLLLWSWFGLLGKAQGGRIVSVASSPDGQNAAEGDGKAPASASAGALNTWGAGGEGGVTSPDVGGGGGGASAVVRDAATRDRGARHREERRGRKGRRAAREEEPRHGLIFDTGGGGGGAAAAAAEVEAENERGHRGKDHRRGRNRERSRVGKGEGRGGLGLRTESASAPAINLDTSRSADSGGGGGGNVGGGKGAAKRPPLPPTETTAATVTLTAATETLASSSPTRQLLRSGGGAEEEEKKEKEEVGAAGGSGYGAGHTRILDTAAAAATTEGEVEGAIEEKDDGGVGLEVDVEGGGEVDRGGVGSFLVPSFCPSEPFERYAALHRDITQGKAEQRYLVFRPYLYCGMGNRLNGFQGVLGLAMITDRALLVDWYGGVSGRNEAAHKYEDNFLEAYGVPHDTFPSSLEDYENLPGTRVWCQMNNPIGINTPCPADTLSPEFLTVANWTEVYAADAQVVILQAFNHNPMNFVRDNVQPEVADAVARLDDNFGDDPFGICSLRFLFQPRSEFKERYCQERSTVLDGKFASVSLHVRTGDSPKYHPEWYETLPQDVENFVACAKGFDEGLAALAGGSTDPDFDVVKGVETVWLLGTDSETVIDLFNQGNHTVGFGGKVAFVEGGEEHRAHSGSKGGLSNSNAGPLIDIALLSEAPVLVGSYHSTFSANIAELGGLPAHLRMYLSTPFGRIFGNRAVDDQTQSFFDDFQKGCRDFVSDPDQLEYLKLALQAVREPFISCES